MEIYRKGNIKVILGDCRKVLKNFKAGFFDTIITDPPYGIDYNNDYGVERNIFLEMEDEFYRVLRENSWLVFWWTVKRIPEVRFEKFNFVWMLIASYYKTVSRSIRT